MMNAKISRIAVIAVLAAAIPAAAQAQSVAERYAALLARQEKVLARVSETPADAAGAVRDATIAQGRAVIAGYDALVRRFHSSGYADNALFNAAAIADALYDRFHRAADRISAVRYYKRLTIEYPTSSLSKRVRAGTPGVAGAPSEAPTPSQPAETTARTRATLVGIERTVMGETVRIALSLDREVAFREERAAGPSRLFFDLKDVQAAPELKDVVLRYANDAVRQIRIGRHPDSIVRVVLDLEGVKKYSVFTMYNPFRVVVDCETGETAAAPAALLPSASRAVVSPAPAPPVLPASPVSVPSAASARPAPAPLAPSALPAPRPRHLRHSRHPRHRVPTWPEASPSLVNLAWAWRGSSSILVMAVTTPGPTRRA